jgi:hypothetical protein
MAKAFISPYLNPSLFKYKNMTVEILAVNAGI